ncbi:MAG: uroporphyrinogen-III synthase [Bacteroidota bacterium]
MPSVFITRQLEADSPFYSILKSEGFDVHGTSFIHFTVVPFTKIPVADYFFFYSKTGVRYFFEHLREMGWGTPTPMRWAAMGNGTAKMLTQYQITPNFIGNGKPTQVAASFLATAKNLQVCFVRAEQSKNSIQRLIQDQVATTDLIVYRNEPKRVKEVPVVDYIVFTSPMNVAAFFEQGHTTEAVIVAIGNTTATALKRYTAQEILLPEEASESSLAKAILSYCK